LVEQQILAVAAAGLKSCGPILFYLEFALDLFYLQRLI
jgi:hypothetical protein